MKTTRRQFLKTSATALVAAPALVRGSNLNSKLQIASIGTDGKGYSDITKMADHPGAMHVAFCDVDLARTQKALEVQPQAAVFQDYREMFEQMGKDIDAVTVSTPDHMHAYISLDAMRRGMHVHCQKPLTHTVWEARQMSLQAEKSKVITRMEPVTASVLLAPPGPRMGRVVDLGQVLEIQVGVDLGGGDVGMAQ